MNCTSAGRDWAAMQRAEFDRDAPLELHVPTEGTRIPAAPDTVGTEALFGDPVPAPQQAAPAWRLWRAGRAVLNADASQYNDGRRHRRPRCCRV